MDFPFPTEVRDDLLPSLIDETDRVLRETASCERPVFLHMLGVPGAGKSSFVSVLIKKIAAQAPAYVGFDRLMEAIPDYQNATDREEAFHRFELPARAAGYYLLRQLIEKKAPILLDHGGSFPQNVDMLRYAREVKGYGVIVVRIKTSPETVKHRIWERQAKEGRHTPLNYVDERHRILEGLQVQYQALADAYFEVSNEAEVADTEATFGGLCCQIAEKWAELAAGQVKAA